MDLLEKINILPKSILISKGNPEAGLCIRFSTSENMWIVSYGRRTTGKEKFIRGYATKNKDIEKAIDDFIKVAKEHA